MHIVIFIIYFSLLCLAIMRMHFFKDCVKPKYLVLLFSLHIMAGCIHTWIAFRFFPNHGDIWLLFQDSIGMKQQLMAHPGQFAKDMAAAGNGFNLIDNSQPALAIQYIILQYVNVFLNFLSFDNLYVNTLLFSFPVFAGTVALYKVFYGMYSKPLPALCILLLPSVLFWTSELYKDGAFYMATGYFLYYFLKPKSFFLKIILLMGCVAIMLLSRANALITLLPAVFFFALSERKRVKKISAIAITITTSIIISLVINFFTPGGILIRVCERQKDFQLLTGGSRIYLPVPDPTISSFIKTFPVAFINGIFQPLPGVGGKLIYNAFSVELLLIWALILYSCWLLITKKTIRLSNFDIACLLFSLPGLIIIGYMVPFAGAIIRYRSIYLPFLLAPFINILCSYPPLRTINDWIYKKIQ